MLIRVSRPWCAWLWLRRRLQRLDLIQDALPALRADATIYGHAVAQVAAADVAPASRTSRPLRQDATSSDVNLRRLPVLPGYCGFLGGFAPALMFALIGGEYGSANGILGIAVRIVE
jgi:hypothetical protein